MRMLKKESLAFVLVSSFIAYAVFSTIFEQAPAPEYTFTADEEPELVFNGFLDTGFYEVDGELCFACNGVNVRCGDELTREDLLVLVTLLTEGEGDATLLCPDKYRVRYRMVPP